MNLVKRLRIVSAAARRSWSASSYEGYLSSLNQQYSGAGGFRGDYYRTYENYFDRLLDASGEGGANYLTLAKRALRNPYGAACTRKISETLSEIELEAYRITDEGEREVNKDHPVFRLLHGPRGHRTPLSIMEPIVHHLHFGGELFIWRGVAKSEGSLRPLSFELISPSRFQRFIYKGSEPAGFMNKITAATYKAVPDGRIVGYEFRSMNASQNDEAMMSYIRSGTGTEGSFVASLDTMMHAFRYNPWRPLRGLPLIESAHMSLVQSMMTAHWNINLGKTGGRIPGYFMPEGMKPGRSISKEERARIEADFDTRAAERQAANKPMVMSGNMRFTDANITPREADFLESDKYNGRKICTVFRTLPILVGDVESVGLGGGSGLKGAERIFYLTALLPFLDTLLCEFNQGIMSRFNDGYKLGYNRTKIEAIQEDMDKLYKRLHAGCDGAFMTINDARVLAGMEKLTGDPKYDQIREPKANLKLDTGDRADRDRDEDENPNERSWKEWAIGVLEGG